MNPENTGTDLALEVKNVSKTFYLSQDTPSTLKERLFFMFKNRSVKVLKAVDNISLEIPRGETLGIIGRNGSGKSTLVRLMSGAFVPDKGGKIIRKGTSMLMHLGVGMSHELTARENIYVSGSALGMRRRDIDAVFNQILQFAELKPFVDSKIKHFSTGMVQRLSFAIAINARADIMFLDEVFAVGDQVFRRKANKVLEQNWIEGRTVVLVSHSMPNIRKYCHRVLYLKDGKAAYLGDPRKAIKMYHDDNPSDEKEAGNLKSQKKQFPGKRPVSPR